MSLAIATVNVNGIRAAARKGLNEWLKTTEAEIITFQEVRAPENLVPDLIGAEYEVIAHESRLKGRAGVAIAVKNSFAGADIANARIGLKGLDTDAHSGRWLEVDLESELFAGMTITLISMYMHSGNVEKPQSMADKYEMLEASLARIKELSEMGNQIILTGDLNIAHTELDIKNWKGNLKTAGFLPEERAYIDRFIAEGGLVDVHRTLSGEVNGPYTWWSQRGKAFDNDAGWRIDYQLATKAIAERARQAKVDRALSYDSRFSDHAPLVVTYS